MRNLIKNISNIYFDFKKIATALFLITSLLLTNSCVTKALWGSKSYKEEIRQFYVGSNGRYIVLVGPNYHYVFTDNSKMLNNVMSLEQKGILTIDDDKTHLKLDSNNNISGTITFEGPFSILPRPDMYKLQSLGIRPNRNGDVSIRLKVNGRRYVARYLGNQPQKYTAHMIKIHYNDSSLVQGIGKAAITPLAVTLDAAVILGKVVVAPFKDY